MIAEIRRFGRDFATKSLVPRKRVYDEKVIRRGKEEWRIWDPTKSKLGAALHKGLREVPLWQGMKILYLGISTGTTASHLSDIVGRSGMIYGVEFSYRMVRELLYVSSYRRNIAPIFADARTPEAWAQRVEAVDMIYCDIAQRDQSEILIRNAKLFLKRNGFVMTAIKARSIDVTAKPENIFLKEKQKLSKIFEIKYEAELQPFEKDHAFFVGRLKSI